MRALDNVHNERDRFNDESCELQEVNMGLKKKEFLRMEDKVRNLQMKYAKEKRKELWQLATDFQKWQWNTNRAAQRSVMSQE